VKLDLHRVGDFVGDGGARRRYSRRVVRPGMLVSALSAAAGSVGALARV
jgi:hypothetical protein